MGGDPGAKTAPGPPRGLALEARAEEPSPLLRLQRVRRAIGGRERSPRPRLPPLEGESGSHSGDQRPAPPALPSARTAGSRPACPLRPAPAPREAPALRVPPLPPPRRPRPPSAEACAGRPPETPPGPPGVLGCAPLPPPELGGRGWKARAPCPDPRRPARLPERELSSRPGRRRASRFPSRSVFVFQELFAPRQGDSRPGGKAASRPSAPSRPWPTFASADLLDPKRVLVVGCRGCPLRSEVPNPSTLGFTLCFRG